MLNDAELEYLRDVWRRAVLSPAAQACKLESFTDMVFDPGGTDHIEIFLRDAAAPAELRRVVASAVQEIGMAYAGEVLNYAPLPLDDVRTPRRWQLQRQLSKAVEGMTDEKLQALVRRAQGMSAPVLEDDEALRQRLKENGGRLALDVDAMPMDEVRELLGKMGLLHEPAYHEAEVALIEELAEINTARKISRSLESADSAQRRHGTKVVATPDVLDGQPRIDGTRMPIAMLLIYLRSMSEAEISREWAHLPPGWLDAIVSWIDRQRVTDTEYDAYPSRHRADQLLGAAHLLSLAAAHVVRTICTLPDHVDADFGHLQHTINIADSVERMAERDGYWTTDAAQALTDLKSARLRISELMPAAKSDDTE